MYLNVIQNKNDNCKHKYAHDMIICMWIWFPVYGVQFYYHLEFDGYIQSFIFYFYLEDSQRNHRKHTGAKEEIL